jgi:hypothetical protein
VLERSLDRLASRSDVRLLGSEVLTSIIEVAGADGGALLRYEPATRTLVIQSYTLGGVTLDTANNERLAQQLEVMPAEGFPRWRDIIAAKDTFVAYGDCGVHPDLPEIVQPNMPRNNAGLALRRGDTIIGLLILVYHGSEELPADAGLAIAREALTNAAKHSQANRIDLEVAYSDPRSIRVTIADAGVGVDPAQPRNGRFDLIGMSERATHIGAALTLASEPSAGTEIVAVWPND